MFNMRDINKLGGKALSVLQLCPENKTQRNTDKAPVDGVTTSKKDITNHNYSPIGQSVYSAIETLVSTLVTYCLKDFLVQYE